MDWTLEAGLCSPVSLLLLLLRLLFLPGVSDVGGLSPSLSASGQAAEEPAEERKQWMEGGDGGGAGRRDGATERWMDAGERVRRVCFPLGASGGSTRINHTTGGERDSDG